MLEIIRRKGDALEKEKREQYYDIIISSSKELNRLIDNLLEYSRTGVSKEELENVNLPKILKEIALQFKMDLAQLKGSILFDITCEELFVYPILFKRLLTNLVSNAIKYRGDKIPAIKIACTHDAEKVSFSISDNGIGIPPNQFDNIFKIFKTITPNQESNGIGLSVCKKIVELHNGKIWVHSESGEGTSMNFTIPKIFSTN